MLSSYEEYNIMPQRHFLKQLQKILKENGKSVPFDIPTENVDTKPEAKSGTREMLTRQESIGEASQTVLDLIDVQVMIVDILL